MGTGCMTKLSSASSCNSSDDNSLEIESRLYYGQGEGDGDSCGKANIYVSLETELGGAKKQIHSQKQNIE